MYKYIVYKTTNIINNYIYIGVHGTDTDVDDLYIGCGLTKTMKSPKSFKNYKFHKAVKKYGGENFIRETLFEYPYTEEGKKEAYKKEAELVDCAFLKRKDVYNSALGGQYPGMIEKYQVCQYEINGKFVKLWDSMKQIEIELGIPDSSIGMACVKKSYSNGYQWRYYENSTKDIDPIETPEKTVYQFDLQGNYITYYKSLRLAEEATGVSKKVISRVCLGQQCQAGGYYWNYKKKFEMRDKIAPVIAVASYTDDGTFVKSYTSMKEAAADVGVPVSCISRVISGDRKRSGGYRWRYFYGNTSNIKSL